MFTDPPDRKTVLTGVAEHMGKGLARHLDPVAGVLGGSLATAACDATSDIDLCVYAETIHSDTAQAGVAFALGAEAGAEIGQGAKVDGMISTDARDVLAARLTAALQIGEHLGRAFEEGFRLGHKPIGPDIVAANLAPDFDEPQMNSRARMDNLEPSQVGGAVADASTLRCTRRHGRAGPYRSRRAG